MTKRVRFLAAAGTITTLLVGGAVAFATIPDATGVFRGCYSNSGALRVIDVEAGQTCRPSETPVSWNQTGAPGPAGAPGAPGAPGPAGPAGGALAYARVAADGTVVQDSGNITIVKVDGGTYCVGVTGGTAHVAVANLDSLMNVGGTVQTGIFRASVCPAHASDLFVVTRPHGQDGGLPGADRAFSVVVF
jgi:hypothetical protein